MKTTCSVKISFYKMNIKKNDNVKQYQNKVKWYQSIEKCYNLIKQ